MVFRAASIPVQVVAIATPNGLVRVISRFVNPCAMVQEGLKAVGYLSKEAEWTGFTYSGLPCYMPGVDPWGGNCGVYLFRWQTLKPWNEPEGTYWDDPELRRSETVGELLFVPRGWVNHER